MNPFTASHGTSAHPWARTMLFVMTGSIVVAAFFLQFDTTTGGSVRMLVRDDSGARTVQTFDLQSARMTAVPGVDPSTITSDSVRIFREADGSVITLGNAGIVRYAGGSKGVISVLVASPVAPPMRTPFAVWGEGAYVAWVSPTDGSVQVFSKNSSGSYVPILLYTASRVNSLGFTEQGTAVVLATLGADTTTIQTVSFNGDDLGMHEVPGLITIIPTP